MVFAPAQKVPRIFFGRGHSSGFTGKKPHNFEPNWAKRCNFRNFQTCQIKPTLCLWYIDELTRSLIFSASFDAKIGRELSFNLCTDQ